MLKILTTIISILFFIQIKSQNIVDSLSIELKKCKSDTAKISVLNELAMSLYRKEPSLCLEYASLALIITQKENYKVHYTETLDALAVANMTVGNYDKSLEFLFEKLKIHQQKEDNSNIATTYRNIAIIYNETKRTKLALDYLFKALELNKQNNYEFGIAETSNLIGVTYNQIDSIAKAKKYWQIAIEIFQKHNKALRVAYLKYNLGNIYKHDNKLDSALIYYHESLEVCNEFEDAWSVASIYMSLGDLYMNNNNITVADNFYKKAKAVAKKHKFTKLEADVLLLEVKLDTIKKDYKLAFENYSEYILLRDSIFSQKQDKSISELQIKYETEKREQENKLLRKSEKIRNLVVLVISVILVFLIILLIFFWRLNKAKLKVNKTLRKKNDEIILQHRLIKQSEEKFRILTETMKDVVATISPTGKLLYTSRSVIKFGGYLPEEEAGNHVSKYFVNKFELVKALKILSNVLVKHRGGYFGFVYKPKDKKPFPVELSYKPEIYNNKVKAIHLVLRDMSEHKIAEQKIKESEKKIKTITDAANDAIILINNKEQIVFWNKGAERMFGYSKSEIMWKNIYDVLVTPELRPIAHNAFTKFIILGKGNILNKTIELKAIRKNGEIFPVDMSVSRVKLNNEWNIVGIIKDITKRKKNQQELIDNKNRIEEAHKDLTDNIEYAKTIQNALLTKKELIDSYFNEYFLLFLPKEQVGGDFYYINKINDYLIFAVADCTGHGVPGGFLTMLGITYLHDIVTIKGINNTGTILNNLRERIKNTFRTFGTENNNGLDIALCAVNTKTNKMQYSGANNPLWIIRNNEIVEYKATRNPIGFYPVETKFIVNEIDLQNDDLIYLFSDGYIDQLGGEFPFKKYYKRNLRKLLLKIHKKSLLEQKVELEKELSTWKGTQDQIDDVTILGVKWKM